MSMDQTWAEGLIPQFAVPLKAAAAKTPKGRIPFKLQGDAGQTRSFCQVDYPVPGVMMTCAKGDHLGIYHVGTREEITIADFAARVAAHAGRDIQVIEGPVPAGTPNVAVPTYRSSSASDTGHGSRLRKACHRPSTGIGRMKTLRRKPDLSQYACSQGYYPCSREKLRALPAVEQVFRWSVAESAATPRRRPDFRSATCCQ